MRIGGVRIQEFGNGIRNENPEIGKSGRAGGKGYRESKTQIIDPIPNERLVRYTKPHQESQSQSGPMCNGICGRIREGDSGQILANLGSALWGFQDEAVALFQDGMKGAMNIGGAMT